MCIYNKPFFFREKQVQNLTHTHRENFPLLMEQKCVYVDKTFFREK